MRRPALTKEQITQFKKDVKLLARHVSSVAGLYNKLPTTFSQNQFSIAMGYTSFSELRLCENKFEHVRHEFDFFTHVEVKDIYEVYKDKGITLQQAGDGLESAIDSMSSASLPTITFEKLIPIMNASSVSEHQYVITDTHPREFKVLSTDAFFRNLSYGDLFIMEMPGKEQYYFTVVESYEHIYDPLTIVYNIRVGMWTEGGNGGFCVGTKVNGVG